MAWTDIRDTQCITETKLTKDLKQDQEVIVISSTELLFSLLVLVCLTMAPRTAKLPEERYRTFFLSEL